MLSWPVLSTLACKSILLWEEETIRHDVQSEYQNYSIVILILPRWMSILNIQTVNEKYERTYLIGCGKYPARVRYLLRCTGNPSMHFMFLWSLYHIWWMANLHIMCYLALSFYPFSLLICWMIASNTSTLKSKLSFSLCFLSIILLSYGGLFNSTTFLLIN